MSSIPTTSDQSSRLLLFHIFSEDLPKTNCSYGEWPKNEMICTNNAIDCISDECICASGWTGAGDFTSLSGVDCHLSENLILLVLYIFMLTALANSIIVALWNHQSILVAIRAYRKGEKMIPKSIAYMIFIVESAMTAISVANRIVTGNRYGYDSFASFTMMTCIVLYLSGLYFFIKSWVQVSVAVSSRGSLKSDSNSAEVKNILRTLKYQLAATSILVIACFLLINSINEEVSDARSTFTMGINLGVALGAAFSGMSLYSAGKVLALAVIDAGSGGGAAKDNRIQSIGENMLKTTKTLTVLLVGLAAALMVVTFVPFMKFYQMYVMCLSFAFGHLVPMTMSIFLEIPAWKKKKSRVAPSLNGISPSNSRAVIKGHMSSSGKISDLKMERTGSTTPSVVIGTERLLGA